MRTLVEQPGCRPYIGDPSIIKHPLIGVYADRPHGLTGSKEMLLHFFPRHQALRTPRNRFYVDRPGSITINNRVGFETEPEAWHHEWQTFKAKRLTRRSQLLIKHLSEGGEITPYWAQTAMDLVLEAGSGGKPLPAVVRLALQRLQTERSKRQIAAPTEASPGEIHVERT